MYKCEHRCEYDFQTRQIAIFPLPTDLYAVDNKFSLIDQKIVVETVYTETKETFL